MQFGDFSHENPLHSFHFPVGSQPCPAHKGQGEMEERQITPDWKEALLTSKGAYIEACLGSCKKSRSPHPPGRILEVYIEALTGLSHVSSPDVSRAYYTQGCVLENCSHCGNTGQKTYSKVREEG